MHLFISQPLNTKTLKHIPPVSVGAAPLRVLDWLPVEAVVVVSVVWQWWWEGQSTCTGSGTGTCTCTGTCRDSSGRGREGVAVLILAVVLAPYCCKGVTDYALSDYKSLPKRKTRNYTKKG